MGTLIKYLNLFFPVAGLDFGPLAATNRIFDPITDGLRNTPRRRSAWFLSAICVDPKYQGKGLGKMLLLNGLSEADRAGVATWIIGLAGVEDFYTRHGFVEAGRVNVEDFEAWDGGSVMFRE